ncbi:MAG: glutamine--tRNA ligase/YqeY domain fusion protein [Chloroherpetonaceae bacterium]|nr:glutamine--tRNA ligase/YqeY domain fusion protein [Chthonomonadaceae bacterium]MDW8207809.1 glutamine--tRNA ligase/YqeY domain fusion protein [Chloroherpetonaceae bacterium]
MESAQERDTTGMPAWRPDMPNDFIREAIKEDLRAGRFNRVHTRFPPEPNAYLHIGHAKAVWIDYGIALDFGGKFNLRFDDTNPLREEAEFVESIIEDVRWLGADWEDRLFFASDYFEQMYEWAQVLIRKGKAYVCDLSAEELSATRGTPTTPGIESPYRNRSVEENLDLFARMRAGEFPDGARTLRAKIDMASPNMLLRDPVMYRIIHARHHRQGDKWCIYPTYDWAHGLEDSIEGITHSLCSQEYEIHRPLYDWFLDQLGIYHPRQIEFARLNLTYTVLSKRRFIELVNGGYVDGYDDPRLPTLAGLRRRGYTPEAIREFCRRIGIAKTDSMVDIAVLEDCIREDLNRRAPRAMAVQNPLKIVLVNYPEGHIEELDVINNPEDPAAGTRKVPFARELYIEQDDFREEPPPKFYRLAPGREVRLRNAYFIRCEEVVKDAAGNVVELRCTYDPETRGGDAPDGRKVKATLHWVAVPTAVPAELRLYDHLFLKPDPDDVEPGKTYLDNLNPNALQVKHGFVEPGIASAPPGTRYQFERLGYFCMDRDARPGAPVFNRTVTLRDTWARIEKTLQSER